MRLFVGALLVVMFTLSVSVYIASSALDAMRSAGL